MRLANVDALKRQLGDGEVIPYADLLRVCQEAGAARMRAEAAALAGALDEAGVVLLFCDRVYLQPDKVSSHRIAALSYPSPPSSPPRFAGSPPSRLGLPVLLAAGYPCLFVRCLNSRMTHQPIPCGAGLPVRSGESTGRDAAGLRSRISELSLPRPAARGTVALQSRRADGGRKKPHNARLVLTPSHVVVAA